MNKPISSMTTMELLAEYNAGTGKHATRFSSRAAGERQVESLRRIALLEEAEKTRRKAPVAVAEPAAPEGPKSKKTEATKGKAQATQKTSNSAAVSASWGNPDLAAARSRRHKVEVNGVVYKSLAVAFASLGMEPKGFGRLRLVLKRTGAVVVEGVTFTLVNEE